MITINNTMPGVIKNIEVKGNTYQDPNNLSKIVSAGIPNGDGTYKMSILSVGENLFNGKVEIGGINNLNGLNASVTDYVRSVDFVPVNKSTAYICKNYGYDRRIYSVYFYRSDKTYISYKDLTSVGESFTTPSDCKFVRFVVWETNPNLSNYSKIKLQEGTVATPYTSYQETKCDIKLPCQLKRIGDVADRLYFDKEENALCIAKRNIDFNLLDYIKTANDIKAYADVGMGYLGFYVYIGNIQCEVDNMPRVISKDFKQSTLGTDVSAPTSKRCYASYESLNNRTFISFSIPKSEVPNNSTNDVWEYLKANNSIFTLAMHDAEKIVLPQSEQIKLNSFANKTHIYTISGEVDATVKATVSKSLASTVQANTNEINILNGKIEDIQGLKESQDFAYETDKGYLICKDTQNGVVKDLKVHGKSLVNKSKIKTTPFQGRINSLYYDKSPLKGFTLIFNTTKNTTLKGLHLSVTDEYGVVKYIKLQDGGVVGKYVGYININSTDISIYQQTDDYGSDKAIVDDIVLIEGDHTQNPPSGYFEGIASVGNGNEIEVLSTNNGNLLDKFDITVGYYLGSTNGNTYPNATSFYTNKYVEVSPGAMLYSNNNCIHVFYDKDKRYISGEEKVGWVKIPYNAKYVRFSFYNKNHLIDSLYCGYTDNVNLFFNIEDKKTILFKDTDNTWKPVTKLNGIDKNNCDIIENGLYTPKTLYMTINGSENWTISTSQTRENTLFFNLSLPNLPTFNLSYPNVICDKFQSVNIDNVDIEGIRVHNALQVRISKSKLSSPDVEGFKKYCNLNNFNVVMLIKEFKSYEINPIFPNSYENETMILFGSGVVAPYASLKITSHAANIIKNQGQRLTRLENDFYKYTVVQNRIMLDSRFAADSATFKIDTSIYNASNVTASNLNASICAVKETRQDVKYDFDLYKLIKRNILVGKDNYDRTWMEECITFYWMDFKISDEMYSELNIIIENQYNPPVDMTPIEPPMEDVVEEIPQV